MTVQSMTVQEAPEGLTDKVRNALPKKNNMIPSTPSGPGGDFEGRIAVSQKTPTDTDLRNVAELPILNVKHESVPFKSLYDGEQEGKRVLIIFIRHFFCGNCQEYLRTLCSSITPDSLLDLAKPTELVIIGCGQPELIPFYAETTSCKFPIYADPTRKLYDLLGMTKSMKLGEKPGDYVQKSLLSVIIQSAYQVIASGRKATSGGHFWQIGGEFLFENGKVTWCHRMSTTRDHAEVPGIRRLLGLDGARVPLRKRWSSLGGAGLVRKLSLSRSRERSGSRSRKRSSMVISSKDGRDSNEGSVMENLKEEQVKEVEEALAILGEGSVLANAQVSALSKFSYLPRLLPAPQALIKTSRPERLAPSTGKVVGARSGGIRHQLNHVAHILHSGHSLPEYAVRCVLLTKNQDKPAIKASSSGPLTWLSVLGCATSIVLVALAIYYDDGMCLLAILFLSSLSTIIGIGSKWHLELPERKATRKVPEGDVVIYYPQGSFMVIKCDEEIARQLYWAPEKCHYKVGVQAYRFISLTGTIMLMFGVIFLANALLAMQIAVAVAYIILNAAYWLVAALPPTMHWDLSTYAHETERYAGGEHNTNFTQALWKAIAITRTTQWARIADIAPETEQWNQWLAKAEAEIESEPNDPPKRDEKGDILLPFWDCQKALDDLLYPDKAEKLQKQWRSSSAAGNLSRDFNEASVGEDGVYTSGMVSVG
ncbi:hypothetical protein MMC13_003060 [Lambiella insularis]|nr:hypothetical protein [Lambiella insularis]